MFKAFTSWLFDGELNSQLLKKEEILKYNSPITHQFIICSFMQVPKFNHYLNEEFNNYDLFKLDKMELLRFMKKAVIKLRLSFNQHYTWRKTKYITTTKLFNKLWEKYPYLKPYEITMLCDMIENMEKEDKEKMYASFGIDKPKEVKLKRRSKKSKKKNTNKKIEHNIDNNSVDSLSLKQFLSAFQN